MIGGILSLRTGALDTIENGMETRLYTHKKKEFVKITISRQLLFGYSY